MSEKKVFTMKPLASGKSRKRLSKKSAKELILFIWHELYSLLPKVRKNTKIKKDELIDYPVPSEVNPFTLETYSGPVNGVNVRIKAEGDSHVIRVDVQKNGLRIKLVARMPIGTTMITYFDVDELEIVVTSEHIPLMDLTMIPELEMQIKKPIVAESEDLADVEVYRRPGYYSG